MRTAEPTARQAGFAGEGRPPKAQGRPSPRLGRGRTSPGLSRNVERYPVLCLAECITSALGRFLTRERPFLWPHGMLAEGK